MSSCLLVNVGEWGATSKGRYVFEYSRQDHSKTIHVLDAVDSIESLKTAVAKAFGFSEEIIVPMITIVTGSERAIGVSNSAPVFINNTSAFGVLQNLLRDKKRPTLYCSVRLKKSRERGHRVEAGEDTQEGNDAEVLEAVEGLLTVFSRDKVHDHQPEERCPPSDMDDGLVDIQLTYESTQFMEELESVVRKVKSGPDERLATKSVRVHEGGVSVISSIIQDRVESSTVTKNKSATEDFSVDELFDILVTEEPSQFMETLTDVPSQHGLQLVERVPYPFEESDDYEYDAMNDLITTEYPVDWDPENIGGSRKTRKRDIGEGSRDGGKRGRVCGERGVLSGFHKNPMASNLGMVYVDGDDGTEIGVDEDWNNILTPRAIHEDEGCHRMLSTGQDNTPKKIMDVSYLIEEDHVLWIDCPPFKDNVVPLEDPPSMTLVQSGDSIYVGRVFDDKTALKHALSAYSVANVYNYKIFKSDSTRTIAECEDENCHWRVFATVIKRGKSLEIKKATLKHTCNAGKRIEHSKKATATVLGELLQSRYSNGTK